jgi:hypothetical protein
MKGFRKILTFVVTTLIFTFSISHAEEASIDGNVLAIPVLQVGADFYSVQLTLHFETDPIEFSLLAANPLTNASDVGASSFANNILTIPVLTYEGVSYNLQLALVGQDPILFRLNSVGMNQEGPASLTLFTANISSQIIQLRCSICHTTAGIASATLSTSRIQYLTSIEPDHLQTNYNSLVNFIKNVPGGSASILSKPLGIDHVGAVQMLSTSMVYLQFQQFVYAVLSE